MSVDDKARRAFQKTSVSWPRSDVFMDQLVEADGIETLVVLREISSISERVHAAKITEH